MPARTYRWAVSSRQRAAASPSRVCASRYSYSRCGRRASNAAESAAALDAVAGPSPRPRAGCPAGAAPAPWCAAHLRCAAPCLPERGGGLGLLAQARAGARRAPQRLCSLQVRGRAAADAIARLDKKGSWVAGAGGAPWAGREARQAHGPRPARARPASARRVRCTRAARSERNCAHHRSLHSFYLISQSQPRS